jgi:hypothetical protein
MRFTFTDAEVSELVVYGGQFDLDRAALCLRGHVTVASETVAKALVNGMRYPETWDIVPGDGGYTVKRKAH